MRSDVRWLALVGGAAVAAWPFAEPHLPVLRTRSVTLLPPGSPSLRLLHLSDLHLLPRQRRKAEWVARLAELEPDLVVSTGDHLSSAAAIPLLGATFGRFRAPGFFVPGNNDYYEPRPVNPLGYLNPGPRRPRGVPLPWDEAVRTLAAAGWTDLTHVRTSVPVRGLAVTLTGTDDAHLRRDRYERVAGPVAGFGIGVVHTPQRRLLDALVSDGHGLVLAGHTHGGQVRLPGAGALVSNCDLERSRARGLSRHPVAGRGASGWLHVSAGLGTSPYLPVRLCCRPEATLLTLLPLPDRPLE